MGSIIRQTVPIGKLNSELLHKLHKQRVDLVKSSFFQLDVLIAFALFGAITALVKYGASDSIIAALSGSESPVAFLGAFLSFALVLRTNICYSRWWEGRVLWGNLIYSAISVVQQGQCWIYNEDQVNRLSSTVIVFAYACKAQLNESSLFKEDGLKLVQRGILSVEELDVVTAQSGWEAYYFLDVMRAVVRRASFCEDNATNLIRGGVAAQLRLEKMIAKLHRSMGGLIRVKMTGLPVTYNVFFTIFSFIFFLLATLAWAPSIGWYTPFVNGVVYVLIRMFLTIGDSLEDPFGLDILDLPLDTYCATIEEQIDAVHYRRIVAPFDLGVGSNNSKPDSISQCTPNATIIGTHISVKDSTSDGVKVTFPFAIGKETDDSCTKC